RAKGTTATKQSPCQPGRQRLEKASSGLAAFFVFVIRLDRIPLWGAATKANPAKAGDAKLRGYRALSAMPVEPPKLMKEGIFMRTRFLLSAVLPVVLGLTACEFGRQPTDPVGRTVTQIFVTPDSIALDPHQS